MTSHGCRQELQPPHSRAAGTGQVPPGGSVSAASPPHPPATPAISGNYTQGGTFLEALPAVPSARPAPFSRGATRCLPPPGVLPRAPGAAQHPARIPPRRRPGTGRDPVAAPGL